MFFALSLQNLKTRYRPNRASIFHSCLLFCVPALFALAGRPSEASETYSNFFGRPIYNIAFVADQELDPGHYAPFIGIKPGDLLTRTGVKGALQFLYETGRFSRVTAEAVPEGDGVNLSFRLRHDYYFNKFSVEGDVDLKGRSLWEWVSLPVGRRFTENSLEEARQAVAAFMKERGFYLAQVKARTAADENTRQVDTVFEVRPGRLASIRSIELTGVPSQGSEDLLRKFGFRKGGKYDRSRLSGRLENLRKYFLHKGYLAASAQVSEAFDPKSNTVALVLNVANFGEVRIAVEGFKIDRNQLRRLLPVLAGEGIDQEILEEGLNNLKEFLEGEGYPEADVRISETADEAGIRVFRYVITPNQKFTVAYVRFKGNRALPGEELLASVEIQPATFFQRTAYSVERLDNDVKSLRSLYESRGYLRAEVVPLIELSKDGKKLGITYLCDEGPIARVRSAKIQGNTAIATEELESAIRLAPGEPYSPSIAERDRLALLSRYNDLGYLQVQVSIRADLADDPNSYTIEFHVQEGSQSMVDNILVLGNDHTQRSVIDRKIKLRQNEPLSLGKLLETQQALYGLGVFDQVRVAPQNPDSTAPYQDVVVRLQESKRLTLRYGLGYQERERLRATVELFHLNIFGSARRAEIRLRGSSIEQQALFSLQQPQFRAVPVDSYFTFSAARKRDVSFDSNRFNLSYQFSQPFGGHSWGMLRYSFKRVNLSNLKISASELEREDRPRNLSTFSVAYVSDSRDDYLDPAKGFFTSTDLGVTTRLLGSNNYASFFSQSSYYHRLPKSLLLGAALRLGLAHPFGGDVELPISERFFAGGASSLRGFSTDFAGPLDPVTRNPLGGNALVVGSLEIRIPFFRFIRLAGFYDAGNVFRTVGDIAFPRFSHTLGLGLRIKTPFGPFRADYGYNLDLSSELRRQGLSRGHLFVTIGPPF